MLYALIGFLKEGAEPIPQSVLVQTTDFVGQPFINVLSAGPLREASGKRAGVLMMFEHENRQEAETFVKASPYIKAGLVGNWQVYEYDDEIG